MYLKVIFGLEAKKAFLKEQAPLKEHNKLKFLCSFMREGGNVMCSFALLTRKILNLTAYNRFLFSVSWITGFIIGSDDRLWSDHSYTFINSFKVHPMLITLLHIKAIIRRNIMTVVQEIIIQKFAVRELPTETLFILEKFWLSFFFYLFKGILKWFHTWRLTLLKNNWLELSEKLTRVKQKLIFLWLRNLIWCFKNIVDYKLTPSCEGIRKIERRKT